eukprot:4535351-Pleurochrysis_carterae.AAC.1
MAECARANRQRQGCSFFCAKSKATGGAARLGRESQCAGKEKRATATARAAGSVARAAESVARAAGS